MKLRPLALPALVALLAVVTLAVPTGASASKSVKVAIGDQSPAMFSDSNWKRLNMKRARYFIPWNASASDLEAADAYVAAARRARVEVLMHLSTDDFTPRKAKLPSTSQYRRAATKLIRRYKARGVRVWGVWNEANHDTQPTYRNPRRAAQFYSIFRKACGSRCTIVPLDLLDQEGPRSDTRYLNQWWRALSASDRRAVRVIGFHNYSETNRDWRPGRKRNSTRDLIKAVRKLTRRADIWLTETGGVVKIDSDNDGRGTFGCNPDSASSVRRQESNAAKSTSYVLTLARRYRSTVSRVYLYSWFGAACRQRFDAGLVRSAEDPTPRPAYRTLRSALGRFGK